MVQRFDSPRRRREHSKRHATLAPAARPLEALEARSLLSQIFTVTNTSDNTSMGSLRWAIGQVNTDGTDTPASPDQISTSTSRRPTRASSSRPRASGRSRRRRPCRSSTPRASSTATPRPGPPPARRPGPSMRDDQDRAGRLGRRDPGAQPPLRPLVRGPLGEREHACGVVSGVRGLAIDLFGSDVALQGAGTFVKGCFLGTNTTGTDTRISEVDDGVDVSGDSNGDVIGGTVPANRDLISSLSTGIMTGIDGDTINLLVAGNLIGTDLTGAAEPQRRGDSLGAGGGTTIGGTTPARTTSSPATSAPGSSSRPHPPPTASSRATTSAPTSPGRGGSRLRHRHRLQRRANNTVGGTTPAAANVISSNGLDTEGPTAGSNSRTRARPRRRTTSSRGTSSAPTPPGRSPWATAATASVPRHRGGRTPSSATSSPSTGRSASTWSAGPRTLRRHRQLPRRPAQRPQRPAELPGAHVGRRLGGPDGHHGHAQLGPIQPFPRRPLRRADGRPLGHGQGADLSSGRRPSRPTPRATATRVQPHRPGDLSGQQITALATFPSSHRGSAPGARLDLGVLGGHPGDHLDGPVGQHGRDQSLGHAQPGAARRGDHLHVHDHRPRPRRGTGRRGDGGDPARHDVASRSPKSSPSFQFQAPPVGGGSGTTITLGASAALPLQPVTLTLVVQVDPAPRPVRPSRTRRWSPA